MNVREYLKNNLLFLDGAMGTQLQLAGLGPGEASEMWNLTHPDEIVKVHKAYLDSGSNVISTNSFGINSLKYDNAMLERLITASVQNAKKAVDATVSDRQKFIAFNIGPIGKLLRPYGDIGFNEAVEIFARNVRIADKLGVDLFYIETMNDSYETKAALLAVRENSLLPVFVSNAYGEDGKLMTGASPRVMAAMLCSMGADAIGANCSFGPEQTLGVIRELTEYSQVPVIMKPNAGLPAFTDGKTVYDVSPEEFAEVMMSAVNLGVRIVGGCCGTSPEYIAELTGALANTSPVKASVRDCTAVSSYTHCVEFGNEPVLIGERINPTGKKRFKQALLENDIDYILTEGIQQQKKGVHILDVNVGLAGIDEPEMLERVVSELQAVSELPLQLDSADPIALERAMRIYNGKPLINSVNGKNESMDSIFPLVRKYGGSVIALTLDENGIPQDSSGRIAIAKKIIKRAEEYGIRKEDIIFDPLTMTVSTDEKSAAVTVDCIRRIRNELGCYTSLGVSNISFGLPLREILNSTFFITALNSGLNAAIMNPYSERMMDAYYSFCALSSNDKAFERYIAYCQQQDKPALISDGQSDDNLTDAVFCGRKEQAKKIALKLLAETDGLSLINDYIIPALNKTGAAFERKKIYLPQLLMSAEAAAAAFEAVKEMSGSVTKNKFTVVLATVKGDIHDIGKNIVRLLLENYGYNVIDLGKDVEASVIVQTAVDSRAAAVGLSALMTTTLSAMEDTAKQLKTRIPGCRVIVGGAVVNKDFAELIGADKYAADAMEAVRYCEELLLNM